MSVKLSLKKFINILIWLSILTSSFDIIGVFRIAGFTVRISQILMLFVMFYFVIDFIRSGKIPIPVGYGWLCLCVVINTAFVFNSKSFSNALGYALWFIFDVFEIIVVLYFLKTEETLESMTRKYINCFTFVGWIGLLQFVLQFFGIYFFVTQQTSMHRCNGFSYEPSYYATYLLMGWGICIYLLENSNYTVLSRQKLIKSTIVITLAIILSTSRMGWLMVAGYIVVRCFVILFGRHRGRMPIWKFMMMIFLIAGIGVFVYAAYGAAVGNPKILKYLEGLGIGNTAAHSTDNRIDGVLEVLEVFRSSPIIGCSLGGVDPAICFIRGKTYSVNLNGVGTAVFAEMLAAFGVIGFAFWIKYLYVFLYKKYKSIKKCLNKTNREILMAFIIALVMEFIILQMNQNILRQYLWMHIAVMSAVYYLAERGKEA